MSESRTRFYGAHAKVFQDETREIDVEGALRAGKTRLCLEKIKHFAVTYPGIHCYIARWAGDGIEILKAQWEAVCAYAGVLWRWNAKEEYYALENGSWVYARSLRSQDKSMRYSKVRGIEIAVGYIDQAEELESAQDVYDEFASRLSQPGYPHQMIISPQSVPPDHWIASDEYFPSEAGKRKSWRAYYALPTRDNAHNLESNYLPDLERRYPEGHPKRGPLVLGTRGRVVLGTPVYGWAFARERHEGVADYDPRVRLEVALDFGKHHPCLLARQVSPVGQMRYLGGIIGHDVFLDAFLTRACQMLAQWFPDPVETVWCCDPAGVSNPLGVDLKSILRPHGIQPRYVEDSNSPVVRNAMIERVTKQLRERSLDSKEAFVVSNSQRWQIMASSGLTLDRFFADGLEFGYVWDELVVSVGNKQMRRPKKDGWYEHAQNCLEYLEANFGASGGKKVEPLVIEVPRMPVGQMAWGA